MDAENPFTPDSDNWMYITASERELHGPVKHEYRNNRLLLINVMLADPQSAEYLWRESAPNDGSATATFEALEKRSLHLMRASVLRPAAYYN